MNVKTTFILAGVLIVVVAMFLIVNPNPKAPPGEEPKKAEKSETSKPVFKEDLGEVVKMTVERTGKPKLVFEKPAKKDKPNEFEAWRMVEPVAGRAVTWEVNGLADKVAKLKYVREYPKGSKDIDDKAAGLDAPAAEITVTNKAGKSATVQIGKSLLIGEDTYVRVKGQDPIYAADADFKDNLKKKVADFRDKDLLEFTNDQAVRVEIKYEGKTYTMIKSGEKWTFESPFKADADKGKMTSLVSAINNLRAEEWLEDSAGSYGFDKPTLAVTLITEQKIKKKKAETQPAEEKKDEEKKEGENKEKEEEETVRETYTVEFGWWADIEKKEKIYARLAGQPSVAVVSKSNYEGIVPKPTEWRDLSVAQADTLNASKAELKFPKETVVLAKKEGAWQIEGANAKAEAAAVDDLLRKLKDLKASEFIDTVEDAGKYGLTAPRLTIRLSIEGRTDPEQIVVGGKSESGLMAYVRRGESGPVAVVKETDLEKIIQPAVAYRDREMFSIARSRVNKVELTRTDPVSEKPVSYEMTKEGGQWKLIKPAGTTDESGVDDLLSDVCRLRARTAVGSGNPAEYGLDKPAVMLTLFEELPPPPKPASAPTTTQAAATKPASTQAAATKPAATQAAATQPAKPTIIQHVVLASKKDNKAYATKKGSDLVYEIDMGVYDHLMGTLHDRRFWKLETSQVTGVSVTVDGKPLSFAKKDGQWINQEDAHVPIDGAKVDEHVKAVAELKAERYVEFDAADPAAYKLDAPQMVVKVTLDDKSTKELVVSAKGPEKAFKDSRFAKMSDDKKVFLLKNESIEKLKKKLTDFAKSETKKEKEKGPSDEPGEMPFALPPGAGS
jgi:hypothetical protein